MTHLEKISGSLKKTRIGTRRGNRLKRELLREIDDIERKEAEEKKLRRMKK